MVGWIPKLSIFVVKLGHPSLFLGVSWVSHGGLGEPEELERDSDLGGGCRPEKKMRVREEDEGESCNDTTIWRGMLMNFIGG